VVSNANEFLSDADEQVIKRKLSTEDGVRYYEQYLGNAKNVQAREHASLVSISIYVAVAVLIASVAACACHRKWSKLS